MPGVQQIENAVGQHHLSSSRTQLGPARNGGVERDQLRIFEREISHSSHA
jgi:hypothetical protein